MSNLNKSILKLIIWLILVNTLLTFLIINDCEEFSKYCLIKNNKKTRFSSCWILTLEHPSGYFVKNYINKMNILFNKGDVL